ncbi:MAG: sensor histidine kinase [Myxococcota bacterium]
MGSERPPTAERDRADVAEGRAETDASLGIERAVADDSVARARAKSGRQLDALIARDRVLADQVITRFRHRTDDHLAGERSASPEPSDHVVQERFAADDSKEAERAVADALLERERRRADARGEAQREERTVAHAQIEAQREHTNERLSEERSEADAVAAEREASEAALEAARRAEADRTDVFAMVTHDLRNPLYVIMANAETIAEGAGGSATREAAGDITSAAARMGRLLTDLLDVARIDAGTFSLAKRPHYVRTLLSEMRQSYRLLFRDRGVTLSVDEPPADAVASFDLDRVVQVLSNLLGNAMKFTPRGGNVGLHVEHDADELVFVVRDDGAGIQPDALPHLFDRFWQRDPDTRRGLGLGLYLSRTIARAHGGDISVQSEPGAGSTFRVSLPMS